ncbi:unnamed protein product [Paramecium sonneborni]|uniref:Uncharacterized protein n=1 Tax=Paramecium sonneborni TaxID=65129 RepID=A0A8S1RJX2_9CILI|nr:unnamed protein product [Paramecium sonneborni]
MNRLLRVSSATTLKKNELLNQKLYDEANRLLTSLQVIPALQKFKEYIERMKVQHSYDSPLFDFKGIIDKICNFALRLQESSGKSELPILILQWAEDITKHTLLIKEVQRYQVMAYKKAGQETVQVTEKTPRKIVLTSPKQLQIVKSEPKLKTFYFRGNPSNHSIKQLSDAVDEQQLFYKSSIPQAQLNKNQQISSPQIQQNKSNLIQLPHPQQNKNELISLPQTQQNKKKTFVIKKNKFNETKDDKEEKSMIDDKTEQKQEQKNEKFEWSSSEEENHDNQVIQPTQIILIEEKKAKELRIKFLISELQLKFEPRVIEIKKTKDQIVYPIQAIVKLQNHWRRKAAQKKLEILKREEKRRKLQERYEELIKKIQLWFRKLRIQRKFRDIAYQLLDVKRRTIFPKKQYFSAILIQRHIRKCIAVNRFVKQSAQTDNLIRKKLITFHVKNVSDKIQNKLFIFQLTWNEQKFKFKLQAYAKKKCDRALLKPFIIEINEKDFFYIFARIIEYQDALQAEIEPNQIHLQAIQYCCQISQSFIQIVEHSYNLKLDKIHVIKYLARIQFEDLVYMDDQSNLQVAGFTDFQYSDMYQVIQEQQKLKLEVMHKIGHHLELIVFLQSQFKARNAINTMRFKVNRRRHIKAQFGLSFKLGYSQVFINDQDEIFAKVIYDRKWQITNKLKISQLITKQLGFPCRENFFDIYQISGNNIIYTEEGQYWIHKELEATQKKKQFSFSQIESCVRLIQKSMRQHLCQKEYIIKKNTRQFQFYKNEVKCTSLVKKVIVSGEQPARAFFMNFSLIEDTVTNEQSISIDVRSLEHKFPSDYIHPYKQPLYSEMSIGELTMIGQRMMMIGKVMQIKGSLRFDVRNLMEVQGMLLNEQDYDQKKSLEKKDDTLQARKLWNTHMRKSWIQDQNIEMDINILDRVKQKQIKNKKKTNQHMAVLFIRSNYADWRRNYFKCQMDKIDVKCYDQESISNYVREFKYESQYGYGNLDDGQYNLDFLQIRKDEYDQREQRKAQEELERKQKEQQQKDEENRRIQKEKESRIQIFQEYCVITSQRILVRIIFNKQTKQLEVEGKTEMNISLRCNIDILSVLNGEVEMEFLKQNLSQSVVKYLQIDDGIFSFVSDFRAQEQLLIEQEIWKAKQNRKPNMENVEGEIYNLIDVFINLNKSKSMYENLIENKYQAVVIRSKKCLDRVHEYIINLSDQQLIFTVYFDDSPEMFKTHIIPARDFENNRLMKVIKNSPPQKIGKLLTPLMNYLDENIITYENHTTNFLAIKPLLSQIFKNSFALRIQRALKIKSQFEYYLQFRKRKLKNIFLMNRYIQKDSKYINIMFFLTQYSIKIVFQQLNEIDGNGNMVDKKVKKIYFLNLLDQKLDQKEFENVKDKWIENKGVHLPQYYEQTYKPLIEYIIRIIRVENPFEISFENEFKVTEMKEPLKKIKNDTQFYSMIQAITKLQVHYKTRKDMQIYNLKVQCTDKSLVRQIGKQFNRSFKIIQNQYYIVNMYKILQGYETQITVDLIHYKDRSTRYRGIHILDSTEMLNIGSNKIAEYIINQVYIKDGLLQFENNQFKTVQEIEQPKEVADSKSPGLRLEIQKADQNEIVNHYQQNQSEIYPETIYNVVYTGQVKQKSIAQDSKNTVQISVELSDFKKLYPFLHQDDKKAMKTISDSIIDSVKVDKQGNVLINVQKINPSLIQVENGKIEIQDHIPSKFKPESQMILAKKIVYFGKQKFLMKISVLEKRVTKIQEDPADAVENHFESLFQVAAMSLDKKDKDNEIPFNIEWELSSEDAQQLTHQKDRKVIANELSKRTLIVKDKFIFLAIDKKDIQRHHYQNCILFLEKGIRPIQHQFRNRKRLINFRDYKQTVKSWKDQYGQLSNSASLYIDNLCSDQQFIVLSGEYKSKRLLFICWNLEDFEKRMIEIPKQQYQELFMKNKDIAIKLLTSYVEYKDNELVFRPPQFSEIKNKLEILSNQYQE